MSTDENIISDTSLYPAEDIPVPKKSRKVNKPTKLRASITPGTVLILLSGRFKGKRVVFLKQLESGLLLVTGPYKVNGVPLRRVNQAYVIATSTKVTVPTVDINDDFFAHEKVKLTQENYAKKEVDQKRVEQQKKVDQALLKEVKKNGLLKYLNASFSLSKGEYPHQMKF